MMSRTALYVGPRNGPFRCFGEFSNSWGAAARIWTSLSERYFGDLVYWMIEGRKSGEGFWKLIGDPRLTPCEKLVFTWTFDRVLVTREHFNELAKAIREFVGIYPAKSAEQADHLPALANILEKLAGPEHGLPFEPYAVGMYWTSVCENPWYVPTGEDEGRLYDLDKDDNHHWLLPPTDEPVVAVFN